MAEGLFKKIAEERNIKDIVCRSCGISAYPGSWASFEAVDALKKYDVDISEHRSAVITQYLVNQTDLFVCMTKSHKEAIEQYFSIDNAVVLGNGIPDPYGGGQEEYNECAKSLYTSLLALADVITAEIIPMSADCIDGILEVENRCFSSPWPREGISAEIENENAHFLCAAVNGNIIGYIGVYEVAGEAYIANLAVIEKYRCYGVASRLLKTAQAGAEERHCEFMSLEVRKSNVNAISLYKKMGYMVVGERKNFYSNPAEDALIMTVYFNSSKNIDE